MNLKGFKWTDENGVTIMYYTFKHEKIYLMRDVTGQEYMRFFEYLTKEEHCHVSGVEQVRYKVLI